MRVWESTTAYVIKSYKKLIEHIFLNKKTVCVFNAFSVLTTKIKRMIYTFLKLLIKFKESIKLN